jgi:DNA-binding Lrp family transcriptional regulator
VRELNSLDYRLLLELMKNSRRSDRTLAKALNSSQPTITRRRAKLEKDFIDGYTAIPKWAKLGYNILAITFVKSKQAFGLKERYEAAHKKGTKWLMKQSCIIMSGGCRGMGMDGFLISVHKSYEDFDRFMFDHKREMGDLVEDVQTVIVNLGGDAILKPLHLKYLAEQR